MTLPEHFLRVPLAHRGLHDRTAERPENTLAAVDAAIERGYGIEIDVQLSSDGEAMVFHDEALGRLTDADGPVRARPSHHLGQVPVLGGDQTVPTLAQTLERVAGRVPVLVEIKDQDGAMGPDVGPLEAAVARICTRYRGPVAVMSFNPHAVAEMARLAPGVPRGITTAAFAGIGWDPLPESRREALRAIADYDRVGASFISHDASDLGSEKVAEIRAKGAAILCWTIRSFETEVRVREIADTITFEDYLAPIPSA